MLNTVILSSFNQALLCFPTFREKNVVFVASWKSEVAKGTDISVLCSITVNTASYVFDFKDKTIEDDPEFSIMLQNDQ